jgi:hypothetical protein
MARRSINKISALLLAAVMALSMLSPAVSADSGEIHIRTAADLAELSESCTLDSWSQGKTVILDADIDLTGSNFEPIPSFGGSFYGQGHSISGLYVSGSGNVRGLFRYIQPSGEVYDLNVRGGVNPAGRQNSLGGIAGNNQGLISGCTFSGRIVGRDSVGGLVGVNGEQGKIVNCSFSGTVTGEHYVGGIVGQNHGTILSCQNSGSINTTEVEAQFSLDELNRDQLNSVENAPVCTDIGGIAGFSSGVIQSCANTGPVGYAHIGYNIGGIVGRMSGYLDGCENHGEILGRKDVGGIAGQLEPEVRLLYNSGSTGELLDALDVLRNLTAATGDNLRDSSSLLSGRMENLSALAGETHEALGALTDDATDWANENISEINSLSARLSWLADEAASIFDDGDDALEFASDLADALERAGGYTAEAISQLRSAVVSARASREALRAAIEQLRQALGRDDELSAAQALFDAAGKFASDCADVLKAAAQAVGDGEFDAALDAVGSALSQAAAALPDFGAALAGLGDSGHLSAALDELKKSAAALSGALRALASAADSALSAVEAVVDADVRDTGRELVSIVSDMASDLADTIDELADMPTVTITPIGEDLQAQRDALGDSFERLLDGGDDLFDSLSGSTDRLLDDLDAVNTQIGVITGLLRDMLDGSSDDTEVFEDVSDEEISAQDSGVISGSKNTAAIEGDVNTGGIVGSMAIEYDFDPEDDLIREGDRSLDFRYQTRAAVVDCLSSGAVTGKEDYCGGIAGLMDLGRVSGCESYGNVTSRNGDYVGGVAGASWGSIRDCWVNCRLSGGDYIGGVAGLGATLVDCRAVAAIDSGSAYLGAIAGNVETGGTVSGNAFAGDVSGGVDGISYAGAAEPADFDLLCSMDGVPDGFTRLELTFVADGTTVAVIPFSYGGGISNLPEIPAKDGYSAAWPELDYSHLTSSRTVEAVYTPCASALADGGAEPEILVVGSFGAGASVSHNAVSSSWTSADGKSHSGTAVTVTVTDPDTDSLSYTVHYRLPDPDKHYALWLRGDGGWIRADYEQDGQYLLFDASEASLTFCVSETSAVPVWLLIAAGLLLAAVLVIAVRRRSRRTAK